MHRNARRHHFRVVHRHRKYGSKQNPGGKSGCTIEYGKDFTGWKKVSDTTKVFEDSTLWEPGRTEVVYLRVTNAGTLALKYTLGIYNLYNSTGKCFGQQI